MWLRRTDGVTGAAPEDGGETEVGDPPGGRGESAPGLPGTPETGFTPEPAAPSATGPGTPPKGLATASYACWAAASTFVRSERVAGSDVVASVRPTSVGAVGSLTAASA